jgi:hypothetical protein
MSKTPDPHAAPPNPPEEGKVAKILSANQFVLNFGRKQNATIGSRYKIVGPMLIKNPDDPKVILDRIVYTKGIVEVTQLFESVCIARPPQRRVDPPAREDAWSSALRAYAVPRQERFVRSDLLINAQDAGLDEEERKIRLGDKVVLVKE